MNIIKKLWNDKACESYLLDIDYSLDIKPDADAVSFLILGDTGSGTDNQRKVAVSSEKTAREKGCDFVLLAGDNFIQEGIASTTDPQLDEKFESMYSLDLPFYAILGNHDLKGNWRAQVDYTLKSSRWRLPGTNYHFNAGPVFIQAINTTCSMKTLWQVHEKNDRFWHLVMGHHPMISSGRHGSMLFLERLVVGLSGIDFFVSGHNHTLEHARYMQIDQIISGGGGSPIKPTEYKRLKYTRFYQETYGYIWAHLTRITASFHYYNADGEELYHFTREKTGQKGQINLSGVA